MKDFKYDVVVTDETLGKESPTKSPTIPVPLLPSYRHGRLLKHLVCFDLTNLRPEPVDLPSRCPPSLCPREDPEGHRENLLPQGRVGRKVSRG